MSDSGAHILYAAQDVAYTSGATLSGAALVVPSRTTKVRITLAISAAQTLSLAINSQTTAAVFNTGAALAADAWYQFDLDVSPADTLTFTIDGDVTIHHVVVKAISGEAA